MVPAVWPWWNCCPEVTRSLLPLRDTGVKSCVFRLQCPAQSQESQTCWASLGSGPKLEQHITREEDLINWPLSVQFINTHQQQQLCVYLSISLGLWWGRGCGSQLGRPGSSPASSQCDGGTSWPDGEGQETAAASPPDRSAWAQSRTRDSPPGPTYTQKKKNIKTKTHDSLQHTPLLQMTDRNLGCPGQAFWPRSRCGSFGIGWYRVWFDTSIDLNVGSICVRHTETAAVESFHKPPGEWCIWMVVSFNSVTAFVTNLLISG